MCKEMLAGPPTANTGVMYGFGEGARGGETIPSGGLPRRRENACTAGDAKTSRCRRLRGGRQGEGASSSEDD